MIDILVGGFYGDEGKGKIGSYIALKDMPEMAVRTGGINAGHTIVSEGKPYHLRTIPSAFLNKKSKLVLAPGSLIRMDVLSKEMAETNCSDRLMIDPHAAVITETEVNDEKTNAFLSGEVGSTVQGVGSAESKRILRKLKLAGEYEELSKYLVDVPELVSDAVEKGKQVFVEGTQGHLLSLYHGKYPYVTSRNTMSSGILSEVGVGPKHVGEIIVVFKAFITRVGGGPLDGELSQEESERLGVVEYGVVTGRKRRVSLFDADLARKIARINSATQIAITKLDTKFKEAYKIREYDKLPDEAKSWLNEIEKKIGVKITLIGTGEDALDIIDLRNK
ncbi:MAG: adenylosuccinate synthetase [Candidatus Marsarchaeota archaeon]|jgi:adenylosuccinate synthase|nr:adenylosuccinate synthetase [Candidatus Marsarchaeota archaeon]